MSSTPLSPLIWEGTLVFVWRAITPPKRRYLSLKMKRIGFLTKDTPPPPGIPTFLKTWQYIASKYASRDFFFFFLLYANVYEVSPYYMLTCFFVFFTLLILKPRVVNPFPYGPLKEQCSLCQLKAPCTALLACLMRVFMRMLLSILLMVL